jgi:hypothetical protein
MDEIVYPEVRMSRLLRVGIAAALLGVAAGVLVSVIRIKDGGDILEMPGYSAPMLVPFLLGGLAVVLAIADMLRRDRYRRPAMVFLLGLTSIATPFVIAVAVGAIVLIAIAAALADGGV